MSKVGAGLPLALLPFCFVVCFARFFYLIAARLVTGALGQLTERRERRRRENGGEIEKETEKETREPDPS